MESSSWNREVAELVVFVFVVAVGFTDAAEEDELIVIADPGETGFSILLVVGSDLTFEVCFVVVVVVVDVDVKIFRWFCLVVGDVVVVVVVVVCFFAGTVLLLFVMVVSLVVGRGVFDVAFLANCRFDPSAFDVSFSWR